MSDATLANQIRLHPFTEDDLYTGNPPAVYVTLAVAAAKRLPSMHAENDRMRAGLLEAARAIESERYLPWSRWLLAQKLRRLANPSPPTADGSGDTGAIE